MYNILKIIEYFNLDFCRFDGRDLLRRLKGKKLMFVGDSLSLNQWQSLTCMLHVALPQSNFAIQRKGAFPTFNFPVSFFTFSHFDLKVIILYRYEIENFLAFGL